MHEELRTERSSPVVFASRLALHAAWHAEDQAATDVVMHELFAREGPCHGRSVAVAVVLVHDRSSSNLSEVSVVFVASFVHGPAWTMGRPSFESVSGDGDRSNALHCTLEEEPRTTHYVVKG